MSKYGEGSKGRFIEEHILNHFYAFELMMAPYAAGHLKMGYLLEELGHKLSGDERFQFYLTNTLEMEELAQTSLPGMASLSEESHLAGKVKKERPILVILGNPPYSDTQRTKVDWIREQIETYKTVDGKPLGEKNPKWLQETTLSSSGSLNGRLTRSVEESSGLLRITAILIILPFVECANR